MIFIKYSYKIIRRNLFIILIDSVDNNTLFQSGILSSIMFLNDYYMSSLEFNCRQVSIILSLLRIHVVSLFQLTADLWGTKFSCNTRSILVTIVLCSPFSIVPLTPWNNCQHELSLSSSRCSTLTTSLLLPSYANCLWTSYKPYLNYVGNYYSIYLTTISHLLLSPPVDLWLTTILHKLLASRRRKMKAIYKILLTGLQLSFFCLWGQIFLTGRNMFIY